MPDELDLAICSVRHVFTCRDSTLVQLALGIYNWSSCSLAFVAFLLEVSEEVAVVTLGPVSVLILEPILFCQRGVGSFPLSGLDQIDGLKLLDVQVGHVIVKKAATVTGLTGLSSSWITSRSRVAS